jgi:protein gp37
MLDTLIEWAHHTLNWWWGCNRVSEGCAHCYAEVLAKLFSKGRCVWGKHGVRWIRENAKRDARKILARAATATERQRVFVNSMSDTFEDHPGLVAARYDAFGFMEAHDEVDWLLLTKRPENIRRLSPSLWLENWPAHIWIGTTVENQQCADHRVPELLSIPAKVRFLSCEPLLEGVDISAYLPNYVGDFPQRMDGIHWVICGGESGARARPMHPNWAARLRDQCQEAGVPFHFKQWGEYAPGASDWGDHGAEFLPQEEDVADRMGERKFSAPAEIGDQEFLKVGKHIAGRLLDGREWNEFPKAGVPA